MVGHALTHRLDRARAIGHRDTPVDGGDHPGDDREVMEIERRGGKPHANLARSRIAGVGQVGRRQIVERGRRAKLDRPHHSAAIAISTRCGPRSEEHTSELQSLMRNSYAVFCLKKNNYTTVSLSTTHKYQHT